MFVRRTYSPPETKQQKTAHKFNKNSFSRVRIDDVFQSSNCTYCLEYSEYYSEYSSTSITVNFQKPFSRHNVRFDKTYLSIS